MSATSRRKSSAAAGAGGTSEAQTLAAAPPVTARDVAVTAAVVLPWLAASAVLPPALSPLVYAGLLLYAVVGSAWSALAAITCVFLITFQNRTVFGLPSSMGIHLVIPMAVLTKLLIGGHLRGLGRQSFFKHLIVVAVAIVLHAIAFSVLPVVSVFKAVSFFLGVCMLWGLSRHLAEKNPRRLLSWYLATVIVIVAGSIPFVFISAGFERNGTGFNGMFYHPNTFGIVVGAGLAPIAVYLLRSRSLDPLCLGVLVLGTGMVYLSECRGGMLVLLGATGVWAMVFVLRSASGIRVMLVRGGAVLMAVVLLAVATNLDVKEKFERFVSKSGRTGVVSLRENFDRSRGGAIDNHLRILKSTEYYGCGFQVRPGLEFRRSVEYDPVYQVIPIAASVEAGFMFTSPLAELGIVGGLVVYSLMVHVLVLFFKHWKAGGSTLVLALLVSNVSEATFFSISGIGMWLWLGAFVGVFSASPGIVQGTKLPTTGRPGVRQRVHLAD